MTERSLRVLEARIGSNDANNEFASTSVVANEDGSVLERLEQVQEAVNRGTGTLSRPSRTSARTRRSPCVTSRSPCTGSGVVDVTLRCQRLSAGATIAAV
jgi:hypothetical protein